MITEAYDASEQEVLLEVFVGMLRAVTKDGGNKRARGEKPPWWRDPSHEAAIFSHLNKWKHGEVADPDSGSHPLVHLAWRALAIAYQETRGKRDPQTIMGPLSIEVSAGSDSAPPAVTEHSCCDLCQQENATYCCVCDETLKEEEVSYAFLDHPCPARGERAVEGGTRISLYVQHLPW